MANQNDTHAQGMLRTQEIMCAADMEAKIAALAHRFWSIHPSSLDDMGLTREEFYASEMRKLIASRTPAEGERQRCMEILEDVPGETLVDRVNRLKDWHQELSNSYHDAIAEARTERDQAVSQVEDAKDIMAGLFNFDMGSAERAMKFLDDGLPTHEDVRGILSDTSTVGGSDGAA